MFRLEARPKPSTLLLENTSNEAQMGDLRHFRRREEASFDVMANMTLLLLIFPWASSRMCKKRNCSVNLNASLKRASSGGGSTSVELGWIGFALRMRLRRLKGAKVSADEIAVA
jgi:hypothetical protein